MKRQLIETRRENLIVCDNENCDFTIPFSESLNKNVSQYINEPCPNCGENLLTEEDYKLSLKLENSIKWINKWFSWLTIFQRKNAPVKMVRVHVHKGINIKDEFNKSISDLESVTSRNSRINQEMERKKIDDDNLLQNIAMTAMIMDNSSEKESNSNSYENNESNRVIDEGFGSGGTLGGSGASASWSDDYSSSSSSNDYGSSSSSDSSSSYDSSSSSSDY